MTVADFIEWLEAENPDREVVVFDYATQQVYPVTGVHYDAQTGKVVIES